MEPRLYGKTLTAELNRKGVLDVDTVKGCSLGMAANPDGGCYGACYAYNTARFRGINFRQSIVRRVYGGFHAGKIEAAVARAPHGFFNVGAMGDPSHAWEHTVRIVEWLAPLAVPIVLTKHWLTATDGQMARMVACGTIVNTSVSALDSDTHLAHRMTQIARYDGMGGVSVARVVSCDFNKGDPDGARMAATQDRLFDLHPMIDNPLRVPSTHGFVRCGIIHTREVSDFLGTRTVSIAHRDAYVGHCDACPDKCGVAFAPVDHPRPRPAQLSLFKEAA